MVAPVFEDTNCDVCGERETRELIPIGESAYHECVSCGLIYTRPMLANVLEVNEEIYEGRLEDYAQKSERRDRYLKKLRKFAPYRKTGNFLEIGCNTGAALAVARSLGWTAKGVDISRAATVFARERLGLDVSTGTVEEAGYPGDYFDAIYTNATLEHLRHPLATLRECCRILRPGGVFYADTVNWDSYTRRLLGANWRLLAPLEHLHLYTPRAILSLCHHAGLEHLKTWTTGVRKTSNVPDSTFRTPLYWYLIKSPLSFLSRFNKKGDSIEFLARKPETGAR
jgi:SAM-dependent methyltransferase